MSFMATWEESYFASVEPIMLTYPWNNGREMKLYPVTRNYCLITSLFFSAHLRNTLSLHNDIGLLAMNDFGDIIESAWNNIYQLSSMNGEAFHLDHHLEAVMSSNSASGDNIKWAYLKLHFDIWRNINSCYRSDYRSEMFIRPSGRIRYFNNGASISKYRVK